MDAMITAAARALAVGDPLGALKRVALRDDPSALALRGIAMAQLGDFTRARALVRRAAKAFGPGERLAKARCAVAEAEIALASRDLTWPSQALEAARRLLEDRGDVVNAAHARFLTVRRLLLIGRLDDAHQALVRIVTETLPASLQAVHALMRAGIALRRVEMKTAREALHVAMNAARVARIPALIGEVNALAATLDEPAARIAGKGEERAVRLDEVEGLRASPAVLVDAFRRVVSTPKRTVSLARRPVLFALVRALAEASPAGVSRETLIARAFEAKRVTESHRARLRVEIGRLRALLRTVASVTATAEGFVLTPLAGRDVVVIAPPVDEPHAEVLALLGDGEAWSSSALAIALGASQRTVQRALDNLHAAGKVQSFGLARARRWLTSPVLGFTTTLLLPASRVAG